MIRAVLVGCGAAGDRHRQNLLNLKGQGVAVDLVGTVDPDPAVSAVYTDLAGTPEEAVRGSAVVVASPSRMHKEHLLAAIDMGALYALVEKPLALTVGDAREMVEAADTMGVKLAVGYNYRHHPAFGDQPFTIFSHDPSAGYRFLQFISVDNVSLWPTRSFAHLLEDGIVHVTSSHSIDIAATHLGAPRAAAALRVSNELTGAVDTVVFRMFFENGEAMVYNQWVTRGDHASFISGIGGTQSFVVNALSPQFQDDREHMHLNMLREFLHWCMGGERGRLCSGGHGLSVVTAADAVIRSIERREQVDVQ